MGQKTHPLGFRLGITQEHKSIWCARFKNSNFSKKNYYANILEEDDKIRTYINTYISAISKTKNISNVSNYPYRSKVTDKLQISNVKIYRGGTNNNKIQLTIGTLNPSKLFRNGELELKNLLDNIQKILPSNRQVQIRIFEIEKFDLNAKLLAELVAEQLEKRTAFRRAIRNALQQAQEQYDVNGIKIQVSGRLNGAEMARSEWIREGRVPLQTLRADIDYATTEANTIYGILGIKIWLFKSEI